VQCVLGSTIAMRMCFEALNPSYAARGYAHGHHHREHKSPSGQEQAPGRQTHDHEHCLLCNTVTIGLCPLPAGPSLSVAADANVAPVETVWALALRQADRAHPPRAPPYSA
jgi:hypothetical protein